MPRFTANSTAIAALLSLGLGLPLQAEVVLPNNDAATLRPERAKQMPGLNALLTAEVGAGLKAGSLLCLDGSARPCADDMPLVTPAGVAVQLSEGGDMVLAPPALQPFQIVDGRPAARDGAYAPLAKARLEAVQAQAGRLIGGGGGGEAAPAEKAKPAKGEDALAAALAAGRAGEEAKAAAEEAAKKAEREAKAAAEAKAKAEARQQAEAEKAAEEKRAAEAEKAAEEKRAAEVKPAATPDADAKTAAGVKTDDAQLDELTRQLTAAAQGGAQKPPATPVAVKDRFAKDEPRFPDADAKTLHAERAQTMPGLNAVLQDEIARGLTADDLLCSDGSARPCAEGASLVSPKGVAVNVSNKGTIIIGGLGRQQYVVGEDGKLRARGSNTAAAKEAAEGAKPTAAALSDKEKAGGKVVTETVTENSVRSSDQDFETRIADAIKKAGAAQASNDDDGDDGGIDLAKVALAGLGALAVGQVLQGNREVALNTGDRVIVTRSDGSQQVLKDDNMLLRQPGNEVRTENYADGSSRSVVVRPDGSQVITIRGADLTVLRRVLVAPNGTETVLIDESVEVPPVQVSELPPAPKPATAAPTTEAALREALAREAAVSRRFTLNQIRSIPEVRNLVAPVDIDAITFDTGSAAINPNQARQLATLGTVLEDAIKANPREVFLIEGHTDAVGSATYNLALSDRRAESVALALAEYFDVPPENLVVQGYGEEYLKVPTLGEERDNRRASVRRITDLLASAR
ncbi:OmpA family protein [Paracoccus sp. S1E-3]|uniref:OmpA family protein n=2 Tax=Paracoccus TaxID=265 RepID=UPI001C68B34A|nr:OmpA family protein [Paracoccus sp. S1E-3]